MSDVRIAPSILAADFARLGDEVAAVVTGGCDEIHVDVMDGSFVPNITIGQPVVAALRQITDVPLDVHLMIDAPIRYIEAFACCGADTITVHVEACTHLHRTIEAISATGKRVGVALNPATPLSSIDWVLDYVDLVLLMSVNPGFGGQKFISSTLDKLRKARRMLDDRGIVADLQVDGGVGVSNTKDVVEAGANVLVAGTAIFGADDYASVIEAMRTQSSDRAGKS